MGLGSGLGLGVGVGVGVQFRVRVRVSLARATPSLTSASWGGVRPSSFASRSKFAAVPDAPAT